MTSQKNLSKAIVKSLAVSLAITFAAFFAFALLVTYSSLTTENLPAVAVAATLISVLVSGITVSRSAPNKGWLYGMSVGIIYAALMIIISLTLSSEYEIGIKTLSTLLLSTAGGGIGGIIGINTVKQK